MHPDTLLPRRGSCHSSHRSLGLTCGALCSRLHPALSLPPLPEKTAGKYTQDQVQVQLWSDCHCHNIGSQQPLSLPSWLRPRTERESYAYLTLAVQVRHHSTGPEGASPGRSCTTPNSERRAPHGRRFTTPKASHSHSRSIQAPQSLTFT